MLNFRDIDPTRASDIASIVRWANDDSIRHFAQRFVDKDQASRRLKLEFASKKIAEAVSGGKCIRMIECHGFVVGEVSLEIDCECIIDKKPNTAWVGIVLGEAIGRGRGIGRKAMKHIESVASQRGAKRVQIGVFEFNTRAQRLYESLGYTQLRRQKAVTWWNGQMWDSIRMQKTL